MSNRDYSTVLRPTGYFSDSITRIAVGPQAGCKVFTLQTLPASEEPCDDPGGQVAGFSFGTSLYLTSAEQPAAVQIGRPADLSSPGWPLWCPSRGSM